METGLNSNRGQIIDDVDTALVMISAFIEADVVRRPIGREYYIADLQTAPDRPHSHYAETNRRAVHLIARTPI